MKPFIPIAVAAATLGLAATPALADDDSSGDDRDDDRRRGVEVATGRFQMLPGGAEQGLDIRGRAVMMRTDRLGGLTVVVVRARGLAQGTTYPTHVHNAPCSSTPPGGGHYQHVIGGPVDAVNEMWPAITTDGQGRGTGSAVHFHRARPDAQSIVVHEPTNTAIRVACLDLR